MDFFIEASSKADTDLYCIEFISYDENFLLISEWITI